jgi:hypothetical protein
MIRRALIRRGAGRPGSYQVEVSSDFRRAPSRLRAWERAIPDPMAIYSYLAECRGDEATLVGLRRVTGIHNADERIRMMLRELADVLHAITLQELPPGPGPHHLITVLTLPPYDPDFDPIWLEEPGGPAHDVYDAPTNALMALWHVRYQETRGQAYTSRAPLRKPGVPGPVGLLRERDALYAMLRKLQNPAKVAFVMSGYLRGWFPLPDGRRIKIDVERRYPTHKKHGYTVLTFVKLYDKLARQIEVTCTHLGVDCYTRDEAERWLEYSRKVGSYMRRGHGRPVPPRLARRWMEELGILREGEPLLGGDDAVESAWADVPRRRTDSPVDDE